ncbi:MAG: hypothetical protein HQK83_00650 [Fibrobacteria bacterium]|nr:hypothetical protein [Fibrobacteria bacterium]
MLISLKTRLVVISVCLFIGYIHSLNFPDTAAVAKQYTLSSRENGLPVEYKNKHGMTLTLSWSDAQIAHITYSSKKPFHDTFFSEIAHSIGEGGMWHEQPLTPKDSLRKKYPGLEQHWLLKGYGGKTGWIGTGLNQHQFFLTIHAQSPISVAENNNPLSLQSGFLSGIQNSVYWIASSCRPSTSKGECYTLAANTGIHCVLPHDQHQPKEIWLEEKNPIKEIWYAIKTLESLDYEEYANELAAFSHTESQSVMHKLLRDIPDMFNWSTIDFQKNSPGLLSASNYLTLFKKYDNDWPFIPVFHYEDKLHHIDIYLHFNGYYQMTLTPVQ